MANNNARFMAAYNRLDNYLQSLVKTSGHVNMIWYLESISPEQKRSELKTIRQFKNSIKSHGVNPGLKEPIVPEEWIHWLLNELEWCKNNSRVIAPKLQSKLNSSQKARKNNAPVITKTSSPFKAQTKVENIYILHDIRYGTYLVSGTQMARDGGIGPKWSRERGNAIKFYSIAEAKAAMYKVKYMTNQDNRNVIFEKY